MDDEINKPYNFYPPLLFRLLGKKEFTKSHEVLKRQICCRIKKQDFCFLKYETLGRGWRDMMIRM